MRSFFFGNPKGFSFSQKRKVVWPLRAGAHVLPGDPARFPEHLRADPVRAYGQYAFQAGFRLALGLAVSCLTDRELEPLQ